MQMWNAWTYTRRNLGTTALIETGLYRLLLEFYSIRNKFDEFELSKSFDNAKSMVLMSRFRVQKIMVFLHV